MLIPQDNDYFHASSMGSGGTIAQEMIDLVDNLIDASPNSKADKYDKNHFSLSVLPTITKMIETDS